MAIETTNTIIIAAATTFMASLIISNIRSIITSRQMSNDTGIGISSCTTIPISSFWETWKGTTSNMENDRLFHLMQYIGIEIEIEC